MHRRCSCVTNHKPRYGARSIPYFTCTNCGVDWYSELGHTLLQTFSLTYPDEHRNAESYAHDLERVIRV